ncbi:hypothetical protein PIB30_049098 [Stylosanthes scabra]|uniref:Uncharacterized protein n=1 Tax=Stylosanthes scabra TaxID=79078 RepID=A0ABU6SH15_9FABA|nr:hypothetical protein [Stylosanthes scabra]
MTATRSPRGCGEDGDDVDATESDAGTTVRGQRRSSDCNSRGCCGERRRCVIPEFCKWIDSSVLGEKSIVDDEFVKYFREHHEFCNDSVERDKYQVTAPSSEDRAYYVHPKGVSCIFVYESIFTKIGVRVPFIEFQVEVLSERSRLHKSTPTLGVSLKLTKLFVGKSDVRLL